MVFKTIQRVSVPNLELFGPMNTELWAKEVEELSVMFYGKMFCLPSWLPYGDSVNFEQP